MPEAPAGSARILRSTAVDVDLQDLEALRLGRRPPAAEAARHDRRRRYTLLLSAAGVALSGLLALALRPELAPRAATDPRATPLAAGEPAPRAPAAPTAPAASTAPAPRRLSAVAETFLAQGPVTLSSEIAGTLVGVELRVGDRVGASQVVARIDPKPYRARLEESQAELAIARGEEELASAELERSRSLSEREVLSVSKFRDARTRWEIAHLRVRQAQARLEEAQRQLEACALRSPIDGLVTHRYADAGEFLLPGENPVIEISDLRMLRIQAFVAEADLGRLRESASASVELKSFPGETFHARVSLIDPIVDLSRGTGRVELELATPDARLRPGLTGRAWIDANASESTLLSPETPALSSLDGSQG